uniref:Dihydrofolate/folylpolyglutamate synthase n=1 Tax=Toxoplasma gondii TaxID=5811 RepID=Q6DKZ3_TOXGO|nr:dihydrofolate/folylpolyglutamate synthase [Toxoplasma gondii]
MATSASLGSKYTACLKQLLSHHAVKLGTDRMRAVAAGLGSPQDDYDIIHVAGTNGKGTTCAKLAACLSLKGYKVGTYTSPHILSFRERIRVDSQMIPEEDVVSLYHRVTQTAKQMGVELTFFEVTTQMAFLYFSQQEVDWAVIETGLGGRLDATNIVDSPRCTVITSIGWDHMNVLGDTLDRIAQEKAGVIKAKTPLVLGPTAAVHPCFRQKAACVGADVMEVQAEPRGEDFEDENIRICRVVVENVLRLDLLPNQLKTALSVQMPLRAHVLTRQDLQVASGLCGLSSLRGAGEKRSKDHVEKEERSTENGETRRETGREDGVKDAREDGNALLTPYAVVVDVAHNETAIERFLQFLEHHYFGIPVRVVVSLTKERSVSVLQPLMNYLSFPRNNRLARLHFVEANHERRKTAVSVLEELETDNRVTSELRAAILAGLEEQFRVLSETRAQTDEKEQRASEKETESLIHVPDNIRRYTHLLQSCTAGHLPEVLRFAYRQATAEQSVLVACGSFYMMKEVIETLGFLHGPVDEIDVNERCVTPVAVETGSEKAPL